MTDGPKYYTIQTAAERLGVSRFRIWNMIKDGQLTAKQSPIDRRQRLIPATEVEELAEFLASSKKAIA